MNHSINRSDQAVPEAVIALSAQTVLHFAQKFFSQKRLLTMSTVPESLYLVAEENGNQEKVTTGYRVSLRHLYTRLTEQLFKKKKQLPKKFFKKKKDFIEIDFSETVDWQPTL